MKAYAPRIADYMIKSSLGISADASLSDALREIESSHAHYVPVLAGKKVVGVLKASVARCFAAVLNPQMFVASDVMSPSATVVLPDESLYAVLGETPNNPYGCTVVQSAKGKLLGMFTPEEAMVAIHALASEVVHD